uniref:Uncharacterized protein n=1 Tax=Manihot esculenta TaxID=3983 RepID=A0A2C9W0P7_MANES
MTRHYYQQTFLLKNQTYLLKQSLVLAVTVGTRHD